MEAQWNKGKPKVPGYYLVQTFEGKFNTAFFSGAQWYINEASYRACPNRILHPLGIVTWTELPAALSKQESQQRAQAIVLCSLDIPTEPEPELEYVECALSDDNGWRVLDTSNGSRWNFESLPSRVNFLGIIYRDKDGKETLRTSIDAAFGEPKRVRFKKV